MKIPIPPRDPALFIAEARRRKERWWPPSKRGKLVALAIYAYALAMLVALVFVQFLGDRTALGMLALFGPRHFAVLPWIPLVALAFRQSRLLLSIAVVGSVVTLVGVSSFNLPTSLPRSERSLRIVSYNTDRSRPLAWRIRQALEDWDADVVALLDCKTELMDSLRVIVGNRVYESNINCLITRFPVIEKQAIPVDFPGLPMGSATAVTAPADRFTLDADGRRLTVYMLHFQSPRDALGAVRFSGDLTLLPLSYRFRGAESRAAKDWVNRDAPGLVVVGDFNMTAESQIFRRDWGDLTNAFSALGWGFGHTMIAGWHRVRIDHVLTGEELRPVGIRLERGFPSEHQPVVVDLAWR